MIKKYFNFPQEVYSYLSENAIMIKTGEYYAYPPGKAIEDFDIYEEDVKKLVFGIPTKSKKYKVRMKNGDILEIKRHKNGNDYIYSLKGDIIIDIIDDEEFLEE